MIKVRDIKIGEGAPLAFILGPCVMESEEIVLETAQRLVETIETPFIFKSSFDKANRSSINSFRGPGIEKGLSILKKVKETFNVPVTTDIHYPEQAVIVSEVVDIIQIPAFLCRQTDLLVAACETGLPVHIKKGQFVSPDNMRHVVKKASFEGTSNVLLTERGTCFGYNNLTVDMRSIPIMQKFAPVCFDATHSLQLPGSLENSTGGERQFIPTLAKAAVAAGANAIYMETHPSPEKAKCDATTQWPLHQLPSLIHQLIALDNHLRS